jgi:hypothetical protein
MTTQRQSPVLYDLRSDHEKMRRLFQRFSEATGEEKKAVAREMMDRLVVARTES